MHLVRTDLKLDRLLIRSEDRRVERLIQVELRIGDVVLETPRNRLPRRVRDAQHRVTVLRLVDEDPEADQVIDVAEVTAADHHLLVDRVVVLGAAVDGGADLRFPEESLEPLDEITKCRLALGCSLLHHLRDLLVELGFDHLEAEVFELPLDRVHAESVGQRRKDVERLGGDSNLLVGPQRSQRAHVVQPICQLDDQDADLFRGRHDHLADRLGLRRLAVGQLVQFRDAIDHAGDFVGELLPHLFERVLSVLHRVMQQGRDDHGFRHAELGEDRRDGQRMGDVGLARLPRLAVVMVLGDPVGPLDQLEVSFGVVGPEHGEQRIQNDGARTHCAEACETLSHTLPGLLLLRCGSFHV